MSGSTISNGDIINLYSGKWSVYAKGSGTGKLLISIEDSAFTDIEGASFPTSDGGNIEVPDCRVRADTTGDTVLILSRISQV